MIDEIIEELRSKSENIHILNNNEQIGTYGIKLVDAIEIVKNNYNDCWISVKLDPNKFPIVPDGKDYVDVIVTTYNSLEGRNIEYTEYYEVDGFNTANKVLAWRYDDIEKYKGE